MSAKLEKIAAIMLEELDEARSNFDTEFEKQVREFEEKRDKFTKEMEKKTKKQEMENTKSMKKREALENERGARSKIGNKVLKINVGGTLFTTKRSTLTQVENSLLAKMFSGSRVDDEKQELVFLDVDPDCFSAILAALRDRALTGKPVSWKRVPGPSGLEKHFASVLRYLGLHPKPDAGVGLEGNLGQRSIYTFDYHGQFTELSDDKKTAYHRRNGRFSCVLSEELVHPGDSWGFKVHKMVDRRWMLLGIIGRRPEHAWRPQDRNPRWIPYGRSHTWGTNHSFASPSQIYRKGKVTHERFPGFETGDEVTMMMGDGDLKMKVQRLGDTTYTVDIAEDMYRDLEWRELEWRIHVSMNSDDQCVELVQPFVKMN